MIVMTKKTIIGTIAFVITVSLVVKAFPILKNIRYSQILDQMNCGVSLFDVKVEMISDDRGGITMDGITIYKASINDNYDLSLLDFSEWKDLPIDDNIVNYYMNGGLFMEYYISNLKNGSWKIVGKNKEDGIYSNIILYVYDEDGRCFYAYKWDS